MTYMKNFDFNIGSISEKLPRIERDEQSTDNAKYPDITELLKNYEHKRAVYLHTRFGDRPHISILIWEYLPEHAVQILERAGFSHYNKNTDSLELTDDFYRSSIKWISPPLISEVQKWGRELSNANSSYNIPTKLWKQLPDYAIEVLETVGYTKYDRKTDSIVFVQK